MAVEKLREYFTSKEFMASVIIVAVSIALWLILRMIAKKHFAGAERKGHLSAKAGTYVGIAMHAVRYIILAAMVLMVLQTNGVNVTSLVAGLGIVSAVAGFALQDLLKDIIMGSNIVANGFFNVGDVVRYNDTEGVVTAFSIKATKIRDIYTNDIVTVCNRNISEIKVSSDWLDIVVPTPYETDPNAAVDVLRSLCKRVAAMPDVKDCKLLGTDELAGSSVNYRLRIIAAPELHPALRRAALGIVYAGLIENNIAVPYQQIDIHRG